MKTVGFLVGFFTCIFIFPFFLATEEAIHSEDQPFRVVVCPSSGDNPRNSEADIVELNDGRLLLAWSRFLGAEDHATAEIAAKISGDHGKTWGEEFTLQPNMGKQNVMSVSFLRLRSGTILFFFLQKNANDDLQVFVRESEDEANTWSAPRRVTQGPGYHIVNNARVIQLSNRRILIPIAYCRDIGTEYDQQVCFCYYSDDDGISWKKSAGTVSLADSAAMEPGLVERSDSSLLMIIRTRLDRVYQSISTDHGDTWSNAEPMALTAPAAPSTIAKIPNRGDLLMIWNNNPLGNRAGWQGRTPLTAALSDDDGATWKSIRDIETDPDSGFAYTSITFSRNRAFLTYYHWKKGQPNFQGTDLIFHSIPIQWFYD